MILKGRLFWKILLGFWLAIVLVSQLLWLGFRAERAPPEEHLAQQLASHQAREDTLLRSLRCCHGSLSELGHRLARERLLAYTRCL